MRVNVDETDLTNYEPIEEQEEVGNKVAFESSQSTQESETMEEKKWVWHAMDG